MISTQRSVQLPTSHGQEVRRALVAVTLVPVLLALAACGDEDRSMVPDAAKPTQTFDSRAASATPLAETSPASPRLEVDPQAPLTQNVSSAFYQPFTMRVPAGWTSVLRDEAAYQVYLGNEEYEITFDHTYTAKESVAQAIGRLQSAPGLEAGPLTPVVIGKREGRGFEASSEAAVMFGDSGFHTNEPAMLEVFAIPADDGSTITVFLTSGADPANGVETLGPLARRIFKTVRWQ